MELCVGAAWENDGTAWVAGHGWADFALHEWDDWGGMGGAGWIT